jgi:phospholipid transport system substrate-binding protein
MKLLSTLIIIFFALISNITHADKDVQNNITPEVAMVNIFKDSITALLTIQNSDIKQVHQVIKEVLIPKINITKSANLTLKKHWEDMSDDQKTKVENYVINSLIRDYSTFLVGYDGFDKLELIIKETKLKNNRAKLTTDILNNKESLNVDIIFKMINEDNQWKIYDLSVSGVSLIKSFYFEFKSIIRRKGFEYFIKNLK